MLGIVICFIFKKNTSECDFAKIMHAAGMCWKLEFKINTQIHIVCSLDLHALFLRKT